MTRPFRRHHETFFVWDLHYLMAGSHAATRITGPRQGMTFGVTLGIFCHAVMLARDVAIRGLSFATKHVLYQQYIQAWNIG